MTDPDVPSETQLRRSVGLKIIALGAVGLILSFGLCQAGFFLGRNIHDGAPSGIDMLGGLGLLLSVLILLAGVVVVFIEEVANSSSKGNP